MEVERETLVEAALAVASVGVFIVIALVAGLLFDGSGLSQPGALTLVGGMVAFIVVMTALGFWLSDQQ